MIELLCTALLAATALVGPDHGQEPVKEAVPLRFDWPRDGFVRVRETTLRNGSELEFAYSLHLMDDGQSALVIQHKDFVAIRLDDNDLRAPEHKALRDAIEAAEIPECGWRLMAN